MFLYTLPGYGTQSLADLYSAAHCAGGVLIIKITLRVFVTI